MERKEEEEEEEASSNGNDIKEDLTILKKQISSHALYGLLLQSHLDCFKICLCNMEDSILDPITPDTKPNFLEHNQPELDQFMETYCMTLNKLKEEIEQPQQESMAFISYMNSQLKELMEIKPCSTSLSDSSRHIH